MLNLQMFGDNDTVSAANELKINMEFGKNDSRLLTVKNPKNDLTGQQISNAFSDVAITKIVVGDKDGAEFTGLIEAYRLEKTTRDFDLT